MSLFSVSKFLGKGRKRSLAAIGSVVSLAGEKDAHRNPTSKLSNVVASNPLPVPVPAPAPAPAIEPRTESPFEIPSDTETASASSYYRTPIAENLTFKPEKSAGDGKDEPTEEPGYAVVPQPENKPSDEWTHLDMSGDGHGPKAEDSSTPSSPDVNATSVTVQELEDIVERQKEELEQLREERDSAQMHARDLQYELNQAHMHAQEMDEELDRMQGRAQEAEEERDRVHKYAQDAEEERDRARIQVREAKSEQEIALARVQELQDELSSTKTDLSHKSQALNALTANFNLMQSQINALMIESSGLRDTLKLAKVSGADEARRLQSVLENERVKHDEQTTELRQQVQQLTAKLDAQDGRIQSLERALSQTQRKASDLLARSRDLEQQLARQEDAAVAVSPTDVEEQAELIVQLESSNEYMAAQLINLQNNLNATERENHMLVDQIRQQASQTNAGKGLNRPPVALGARGYNDKASISGVSITRIDSAVRAIKLLNDEIYQTAASMTEQLEGMSMRFVASAGEAGGHHHRRALVANLKSLLGTELVTSLAQGVSTTDDDSSTYFVRLQTALQGCLIASCLRIITSWYPIEWEYGTFLMAMYERIRGTDGPEKALQWRKAAIKNCVPAPNLPEKIVSLFINDITQIIHLCGWGEIQLKAAITNILTRLTPKLAEIAGLALRLNKCTASGVAGELECTITKPGLAFDSEFMENDDDFHPGDRLYGPKRNAPMNEQVICTVGLGLQLSKVVGEAEQMLLKPKVVLHSALF